MACCQWGTHSRDARFASMNAQMIHSTKSWSFSLIGCPPLYAEFSRSFRALFMNQYTAWTTYSNMKRGATRGGRASITFFTGYRPSIASQSTLPSLITFGWGSTRGMSGDSMVPQHCQFQRGTKSGNLSHNSRLMIPPSRTSTVQVIFILLLRRCES